MKYFQIQFIGTVLVESNDEDQARNDVFNAIMRLSGVQHVKVVVTKEVEHPDAE